MNLDDPRLRFDGTLKIAGHFCRGTGIVYEVIEFMGATIPTKFVRRCPGCYSCLQDPDAETGEAGA